MTRSPWNHDPRIKLTEQKAAKLFLERHGHCRECGSAIGPNRPKKTWIVEHVIALENGGSNDWDNLGITCTDCKAAKDARDHKLAAKIRSVATKHLLPMSMRRSKMPFGRDSKLKRKLNGQIEER